MLARNKVKDINMMFSLCSWLPSSNTMNVTMEPTHPTDEKDRQIMDKIFSSVNDFKEIAVFTPCTY
jgi:hypothetical protein